MIVSKTEAERILGKPLKSLGDLKARDKGKRSYYVLSESGKNMGGPYTKSGAKERLRQVEAFKHMKRNPVSKRLAFVAQQYEGRPEVAEMVERAVEEASSLGYDPDATTSWEQEIPDLARAVNKVEKRYEAGRINDDEREDQLADLQAEFALRIGDYERLESYFPEMTAKEIRTRVKQGIHMRDTIHVMELDGGYVAVELKPSLVVSDMTSEMVNISEKWDELDPEHEYLSGNDVPDEYKADVMASAPTQHWVGSKMNICLQCWRVNYLPAGLAYIHDQSEGTLTIYVIFNARGAPVLALNTDYHGVVDDLAAYGSSFPTGELWSVAAEFMERMGLRLNPTVRPEARKALNAMFLNSLVEEIYGRALRTTSAEYAVKFKSNVIRVAVAIYDKVTDSEAMQVGEAITRRFADALFRDEQVGWEELAFEANLGREHPDVYDWGLRALHVYYTSDDPNEMYRIIREAPRGDASRAKLWVFAVSDLLKSFIRLGVKTRIGLLNQAFDSFTDAVMEDLSIEWNRLMDEALPELFWEAIDEVSRLEYLPRYLSTNPHRRPSGADKLRRLMRH